MYYGTLEVEVPEECQCNTHVLVTKICNHESYLKNYRIIFMVHKGMYMGRGSPILPGRVPISVYVVMGPPKS